MASRPDSDIKRSIETELRRCLSLDDAHIAVRVFGGAVTLTGWVRKNFHKYGAEDAVKRVAGITAIANDVRPWHVTRRRLSDPRISAVTLRSRCRGRMQGLPTDADRFRTVQRPWLEMARRRHVLAHMLSTRSEARRSG